MKTALYRLLRWSQKYTKTDMLYLAKGGFWLSAGHAVYLSSGFVVAVAFANLVPREVLGTFQFIMAMSSSMAALTLTGMGVAVMRAVARGSAGALREGFRTSLYWSFGVIFTGAALGLYYHINGNDTLAISFIVVGALSPFLNSFGLTKSYFVGKKMFRENAVLGIWRRLIPVCAILVTIALTHDVITIVCVYFLSNTISAGLLYALVIRKYHLPVGSEEDLTNYSKHLSLMRIFSEATSQADKVLVWVFLGAAPVAIYTLAQLPVKHMEGAFKLLYSLTFAKISVQSLDTLKGALPGKVRILMMVAIGMIGTYALAAPLIFGILFPNYPESVLLSQVLALVLLSKPRSLYVQAFIAHKKKREQYLINISASVLKIILLLILLPLYGLWGVAYALLGTHLYLNILVRYLFHTTKTTSEVT